MSLKVGIHAVSSKSGGAATYIKNLTQELTKLNSSYRFVFFVPDPLTTTLEKCGENVEIIGTRIGNKSPWKRFLWDQVVWRRIVHERHLDVLVSVSDFGLLHPPCRQILMIRNALFFSSRYRENILPRMSVKFKIIYHLKRLLVQLSVTSADIVMFASKSMLLDVNRCIALPAERASVNYFGVPLERFRHRSLGEPEGQIASKKLFRILYVSEYSDYKNLTTLLRAILLLRERGVDDVRLVSTLDPSQFPDVEVSSRVEDIRLSTHPLVASAVKFVGAVPYDDIPQLYAQADLFVFSSLVESFGHPLVEAMASGLAILASDVPLCREICGDAAVYFSPLDPNDLADKVVSMQINPDRREELGKLGRERSMELFDWKDHVKRLLDLIDKTAKENE